MWEATGLTLARRKKRYPEKREQFRALAIAGVPYKTIQVALGIAHGTVFMWLAEMMIPARKRGPKAKAKKELQDS